MINIKRIPQDCSVKRLFPNAEESFKSYEPLGYAKQYVGFGYLKIPYWDLALDPCEDNVRGCDGVIEHDNYMCLCKWSDGSAITFRFDKFDI
jgi:hypothetical protein